MNNLYIIISTSLTALGLLISTITFISKATKNAKGKKKVEQLIAIGDAVVPYIQKAEEYIHFTGAEKKEYVLTKANQFAIDNKIPFNTENVSNKVEELVALTKAVNCKGLSNSNNNINNINNNSNIWGGY